MKKYLFFIITFFVGLLSCNKLLNKRADSTQVLPNTVSNIQALLDDANIMNFSTPNIGQASCDEYYVTNDGYNTSSVNDRKVYKWEPFEYLWPNDWSNSYSAIYNCNISIEQIERIKETESNRQDRNNVIGSAYFFRGFHFLNLVWTFSKAYDSQSADKDLGIALRTSSDFHIPSQRASVKETYEKIISDIKYSINFLPNLSKHPMRPSKAAAYGTLSRVYLSMAIYDSASYYADLCLKVRNNLMDFKIGGDGIIGLGEFTPFKRFNPETIFYSQMSIQYSISLNSYALIDTLLVKSFEDNDLRKLAYFYPVDNLNNLFKGNYTEGYEMFTGIAVDEIYLIRAECFARKGNVSEAMIDLNKLLQHRYDDSFVPLIATTSDEALSLILRERRKELLQRGLRWMDIKRLNVEGRNISLKRIIYGVEVILSPNDKRFALPLPKDIIDLAGIPQN